MKKIEIYKNNELQISIVVTDYEINTYTNQFEIVSKIEELQITYSFPFNKGYKIVAEI